MQPKCLPKCSSNVAIRCYSKSMLKRHLVGNCNHVIHNPIEPIGCNEGEIRLADGGFSQRGRVEHCLNGVWGTVCDSGWDHTDAVVLCKSLGYPGTGTNMMSV